MRPDSPGLPGGERGAALLIVLLMVVVVGLTVAIAGSSWSTIRQRAREAELFWRGDQYRQAIMSYYGVKHGRGTGQYPRQLEDLVKDPRFLETRRHLRKLYNDPMTGGDWVLIKEPSGRIIGVRSSSGLEPFKTDGFPEDYESFAGAEAYSAWEFAFRPESGKKTVTPVTPGQAGESSGTETNTGEAN